MGVGVTLRVVMRSNCHDIARRPGSDFGDIPDIKCRSGSSTARLGTDDDVGERARLHRTAMLLVIVCFFLMAL